VVDGDSESARFRQQILNRGFNDDNLNDHFATLPPPNNLEDQLIADGHEVLLRKILAEISGDYALTCSSEEFRARLNRKTRYMSVLAPRIAADAALAARMPAAFVDLVARLRSGMA
jgi:putative ATP-dependent endonuclease of OLD family